MTLRTLAFVLLCTVVLDVGGQTTGKSYSTDVKRPVSIAPQFPSPVSFTDVSLALGIGFVHNASPTSQKYLPETMSAGVALLDVDNDGRLDIFFTNGAEIKDPVPKRKLPEKSDPKYWNRLYRQKPDGTFDDITERSGLIGTGYAFGVAVGDYDRDGFVDIFVTYLGGATLYRNNGNSSFTDVTKKSGISVDGWPVSAGFFDFDNDGRLDLFVTRYVIWDFEKGALYCGEQRNELRSYCHPDNFAPTTSLLFHQKAIGTFEDVSRSSGIEESKGKALGVTFADFNDDGLIDIFVANDNSEQQLFQNRGSGTFENIALPAGVALDENGKRFAGMGVDAGDFNGDGRQDVFITAFSGETYPLFQNLGDGSFNYVSQQTGVAQITNLGTGWGAKFVDVDNDGRQDIFCVQGHVSDVIQKTTDFLRYRQPPLLIRNSGKSFQNISFDSGEIFKTELSARGLAVGDLDNDGDKDIVISQTNGPAIILRNNGAKAPVKNHWVGIELKGIRSSPNGEGARVTVTDASGTCQTFDVTRAGSYLAASDPRIIVGFGKLSGLRNIEIRWPSGKSQILENPSIDRYHLIKEN
jgi:hypothetical protein